MKVLLEKKVPRHASGLFHPSEAFPIFFMLIMLIIAMVLIEEFMVMILMMMVLVVSETD